MRKLKINELEELNYLAEETIQAARFTRFRYTPNGDIKIIDPDSDAMLAMLTNAPKDVLNFSVWEMLPTFTIGQLVEMSFAEVKEKYLKNDLPMLRGMMRKGTGTIDGICVDESVPDDYIDDLLALRWLENMKLHWVQCVNDKQ